MRVFYKLRTILDKPLQGLSFYFILAVVVLWNNCGTSFVDDSLEWIVSFEKFGWKAYWHSYDMTSVYWFHDLFSNLMHLVFGKNNFAWYFIILSFHSSACYYMYRFLVLIFAHKDRMNGPLIAFISSLIFLFGAYHTENIFWLATYHYEVTIIYLFVGLFYLAQDRGFFVLKHHWWIPALFPFMLTMHEISFFFPFAFIATIIYFRFTPNTAKKLLVEIVKFGLPFGISSIAILICTKLIKGSFIPHYGISHVQDHTIYGFLYTLVNYLTKHLLFIHNFSFPLREKFYVVDSKTMYVVFALCIGVLAYMFYRIRKNLSEYSDYFLLIALLVLFYIPVSNMYFFWHFPIQNDRLAYYTSAFIYTLITLGLITYLKKLGVVLAIVFLFLNVFFLRKNISNIEESIYFTENIAIPSYKPFLNQRPVVLNIPYNYKGFYSFRKIFRFKSAMYWAYNRDIDFVYTASMPFFQSSDSVEVKRIGDSIFSIQLRAPGAWLMRESLGGSDFENTDVKVDYADDNQSAMIYLKTYDKNQPVLYCTGSRGFIEFK